LEIVGQAVLGTEKHHPALRDLSCQLGHSQVTGYT
jgi:hypothetical protein